MSKPEANPYLHEVAITAIVIKNGKYLITRRSLTKKKLPGMWTVPGGKLEAKDYTDLPPDATNAWYNILERTLKREVKEETSLTIDSINYLTSLTTFHPGFSPSLIISCTAKYISGKVRLQKEETDKYAWVSLKEAKNYDLIEGIYDELVMTERQKKSKKKLEWTRVNKGKTYICTVCSREKSLKPGLLQAKDRYISKRVRNVLSLARREKTPALILSGKYGLILPEKKIPYYDHLLIEKEIRKMTNKVIRQCKKLKVGKIIFYAKPKDTPNWKPYYEVIENACHKTQAVFEPVSSDILQ